MPSTVVGSNVRKAMKLNTIEGAFAVTSDNLAGPYLSLFALAFGASPSQIGLLNAIPNFLGNILQIPYGLLADRSDKRVLCIVGGLFGRISWILMMFLPFLFAVEKRVTIIIAIASFRVIMANLGAPAWAALQAGIIPRSIRGKYYANRNVALNISALGATFAAGWLLKLRFPLNYQVLFISAAVFGVVSTGIFSFIPFGGSGPKERSKQSVSRREAARGFINGVKGQRDFTNYIRSSIVWNFGVSTASSLFAVHFVENLGGHDGAWAIVTASSIIAQILCQRYWGPLADRFGPKNIMSVSGIAAASLPLMWLFAPASWVAVVINFIGGFAWGGYNLAAFNLLLELTPDDERPMYVGVYNTMMGFATATGPILGGFAAEILGLRFVFGVSFILRSLGLVLFNRNVGGSSDKPLQFGDLLPRRKVRMAHRA